MSKILVIGHSHIIALMKQTSRHLQSDDRSFEFLLLRQPEFWALSSSNGLSDQARRQLTTKLDGINREAVSARIAYTAADATFLCINGNEHSGLGLFKSKRLDAGIKLARMAKAVRSTLPPWLDFLMTRIPKPALFYPSPPPVSTPVLEGHFPPEYLAGYKGLELEPMEFRRQIWLAYCGLVRRLCESRGIRFVPPPEDIFDASGFLARRFWGNDPMHGNSTYGALIREHLCAELNDKHPPADATPGVIPIPRGHPYRDLPDTSFWKQSISLRPTNEVDPVLAPPFRICQRDQVATAGSCFAQHISKQLRDAGFQFMTMETGPDDLDAASQRGFYDFSARYGNIYTARQLLQLFDRAFGYFRPIERVWVRHEGGFCDPFRPRIEPAGFTSEADVEADAHRHLRAVRRMFQHLDVFIFTLGLTECWISRLDGAAYPVAPGVVGGAYDRDRHAFVNFGVADVSHDLQTFLTKLRLVNTKARVVLTVSPVPLVATASDRHVLVATTYSKSVLRVAAEEVSRQHPHVAYFPSYEIITGPHSEGRYFEADRRSVTKAGVDHVMRVFMTRMTDMDAETRPPEISDDAEADLLKLESLAETMCDEEVLAR